MGTRMSLFGRACCNRTKGDSFQLTEERFRLNIGKFFTVRIVRPWHRLPRGTAADPSLPVSKARLDTGAWSNLG